LGKNGRVFKKRAGDPSPPQRGGGGVFEKPLGPGGKPRFPPPPLTRLPT